MQIFENIDCLEGCKKLDDKSVDCVITSPPYWQLRDYGYPEQWGLEPTYQEYLEHLWSLMDEIWRVLKDEGTVWINLGDSYSTQSGNSRGVVYDSGNPVKNVMAGQNLLKGNQDMPSKCLMLIPHRFAIGCIDRGWILRNDIIWAKRNGMPESVTDRFSKKHEFIFFFTKHQKYYFDLDGIRKPLATSSIKRLAQNLELQNGSDRVPNKSNGNMKAVAKNIKGNMASNGLTRTTAGLSLKSAEDKLNYMGVNPGDVSDFWDIPTKPSSEKHYASYNTKLIDKPILAGCPKGGVILDPFAGTGTTLIRAMELDRDFIGFEMSKEYFEAANKRIEDHRSQYKLAL